jgi:hypothetical protein
VASRGYIATLLNSLPANIKTQLTEAFDYAQTSWRLGDGARATNAQLYKFNSTTAATANEEFSIRHGMGMLPSKLVPVLDLNQVGSQIVPLVVSRAPDEQRVYLKSSSTGAVFQVYLEV